MSCIQRGWPSMSEITRQTASIGASITIISGMVGGGPAARLRSNRSASQAVPAPRSDRRSNPRIIVTPSRRHAVTPSRRSGQGHARRTHLIECALAIARLEVHAAIASVRPSPEAEPGGIDGGRFHAVVRCEAGDHDAIDARGPAVGIPSLSSVGIVSPVTGSRIVKPE